MGWDIHGCRLLSELHQHLEGVDEAIGLRPFWEGEDEVQRAQGSPAYQGGAGK